MSENEFRLDADEIMQIRARLDALEANILGSTRYPAPTQELEGLRKEIKELRRYNADQVQDRCENAFVESSVYDAMRQALYEVAPDHPILKGAPPAYGVWTKQQKKIEEQAKLIDELRFAVRAESNRRKGS